MKKHKQILAFILKAAFVVGLLYFMLQKGFISVQATRSAFSRPEYLLPAVLVLVLLSVMGAIRWQWLLQAQGIRLGWSRVFQLSYIGGFFNIALPGAVSGDFVKAFYIGREAQGQRARAFGAILFDRVAGLSALAFVAAGAMLVGFSSFQGTPVFVGLKYMITFAAAGAAAFYAYLFLMKEKHDPLFRLFHSLEKRFPKTGSLARIYNGIRHYHHHRWVVLKVLILSILVHLIVGWSCWYLARALGEQNIGILACYVVVPLGLLVTAIPVMPAGVGTGHAAFLYLFSLVGSERGADVFTLYALINIMVGAFGGIIYLRFRGREPAPVITA